MSTETPNKVQILSLVSEQHPLLRSELKPYDFSAHTQEETLELAHSLIDTMRRYRGIGLSANQVGLPHRVFAMEGEPAFVCFNPVITAHESDEVKMLEGCLSYPGLGVQVKRPSAVRVRFFDPYGNACVKVFTGMSARVFQHEYDHMQGANFLQRVNSITRDAALRKYKKLTRMRNKLKR